MIGESDETSAPTGGDQTDVADWQGLGDLFALATERLTAPVEGMHNAIANRWFGLAGSGAVPVRKAYTALTAGVYSSVRMTGSVLGSAMGLGAAVAGSRNRLRPLWHSSRGSGIQAAVNAVWGDELERRHSTLQIQLGLRDINGDEISPDLAGLANAYPEPTARLAVLIHGLGETERCWRAQTDEDGTALGLGDILTADSLTPLLVRYNTGKHVSENGDALADLLEDIVQAWPLAVEDVALIGNSMGGLVARSSLDAGRAAGHRWAIMARNVVTLGTPHLGAPLEKGANLISRGLGLATESRPLSEFLDYRSAGIKDLRFGAVTEDDWRGDVPDAASSDIVGHIQLPEGVEQHFIAGVITTESTHPVGVLVGDLIVRVGSGIGRGRRRHVEATDVRVLGGRRHFDLAHDPVVHEQVRVWLAPKM